MADAESSKACVSCGEVKPLASFRKSTPTTWRSKCKTCSERQRDHSPEARQRRNLNQKLLRAKCSSPERKAKAAAYFKAYGQKHKERLSKLAAEWRARNAERIRARYQHLPEEKKEEIRKRSRQWRAENRERKVEANRQWAQANRDKMAAYFRKSKDKRRSSPVHRVYESVSAQIRNAITKGKAGRTWESIVGYSLSDLVAHLERQFIRGITWANYGTAWHIDHIVPQADFELAGADDATIRACWCLSNLRPLASFENASKGRARRFLL